MWYTERSFAGVPAPEEVSAISVGGEDADKTADMGRGDVSWVEG